MKLLGLHIELGGMGNSYCPCLLVFGQKPWARRLAHATPKYVALTVKCYPCKGKNYD